VDDLQLIIQSFNKTEQKEFRKFIQRRRFKTNRIDLKLFDLFVSVNDANQVSKQTILTHLYGSSNVNLNPYHSVRKRLVKHLNDFIFIADIDNDESVAAEIGKNLILIKHLFAHDLHKQAWKYLKKSENIALKAELNGQLTAVYDIQIEYYSPLRLNLTLEELVKKRMEVAELAKEDQNLRIVGSFVKQELTKVKKEAAELDLERILNLLLNTFDMQDSLFRRPKLRYNFVLIARGIILANKQFYAFEEYIIDNYKKIVASGYFNEKPSYRLNLLYIISHTLYRNKKVEEAKNYLAEMKVYLNEVSSSVFKKFNAKYYLLLAACENINGNLDNAICILEDLRKAKFYLKEDELNALLNLSVYYFQKNDFKMANKTILKIDKTDNWLEKNIGLEWRIKKNMIGLIYQFELGNFDLAYDRIISLERSNNDIFKTKKYNRIVIFLRLIKMVIVNPNLVTTTDFAQKVEDSFDWVGAKQEDLQAMSYYAWLKAKMLNDNYYSILLALMKAN
jgi:hypothetical protein